MQNHLLLLAQAQQKVLFIEKKTHLKIDPLRIFPVKRFFLQRPHTPYKDTMSLQ